LKDDGYPVEPLFYVPIIPMVLVNGSKGIGTGFSTDVMCYNPKDIITYLKNKLEGKENNIEFIPHYDGFKGTIGKITDTKFLFKGCYSVLAPDKVRVTELPIGFWTQDFKEHLEGLQETVDKDGKKIQSVIKDYDDMSKDTSVDFTIMFQKGKLDELLKSKADYECNGLEKLLKLYTTNTITNMNLFNHEDRLRKYENIPDIIDDYYGVRLDYYDQRKQFMMSHLEKQLSTLSNKAKYIQEVLDGSIELRKKKKTEVVALLLTKKYDVIDEDQEYKYLLKMPMDSVTEENIDKLLKDRDDIQKTLEIVKNTSIQQMWSKELNDLEKVYLEFIQEKAKMLNDEPVKKVTKIVKKMKV
jgi:DNA topoisomerase-2